MGNHAFLLLSVTVIQSTVVRVNCSRVRVHQDDSKASDPLVQQHLKVRLQLISVQILPHMQLGLREKLIRIEKHYSSFHTQC